MRWLCILVLSVVAASAIAGLRVKLGPHVSVTVPRAPKGWRGPLRDLDADFGKLHVTAGMLPRSSGDLKSRASNLARELSLQHDSKINWSESTDKATPNRRRVEFWFNARQEDRRTKGVVVLITDRSVTYAVTCFWPRTSRQAEIDAHRIVKSFG